jgi:hypothetical protein
LLGLALFTGLFVLLAFRPRHYAGVWELVIANKFALAGFGMAYGAGTKDAGQILAVDGAVAVLLLVAYVLGRGWRAWASLRRSPQIALSGEWSAGLRRERGVPTQPGASPAGRPHGRLCVVHRPRLRHKLSRDRDLRHRSAPPQLPGAFELARLDLTRDRPFAVK